MSESRCAWLQACEQQAFSPRAWLSQAWPPSQAGRVRRCLRIARPQRVWPQWPSGREPVPWPLRGVELQAWPQRRQLMSSLLSWQVLSPESWLAF